MTKKWHSTILSELDKPHPCITSIPLQPTNWCVEIELTRVEFFLYCHLLIWPTNHAALQPPLYWVVSWVYGEFHPPSCFDIAINSARCKFHPCSTWCHSSEAHSIRCPWFRALTGGCPSPTMTSERTLWWMLMQESMYAPQFSRSMLQRDSSLLPFLCTYRAAHNLRSSSRLKSACYMTSTPTTQPTILQT